VTFGRDAEERTASRRLFQTEVAASEKAVLPMVARIVREITVWLMLWMMSGVAAVCRHQRDSSKCRLAASIGMHWDMYGVCKLVKLLSK